MDIWQNFSTNNSRGGLLDLANSGGPGQRGIEDFENSGGGDLKGD